MPRLAAALVDQPHRFDAHSPIDRLSHVVDGEAGDRGGGQCLHLDAGRSDRLGLGAHDDAGKRFIEREVDRHLGQGDRVAERNQFVGALGRHDAGDPRRSEHVALLRVARADERQRLGPHDDATLGDRRAFARRLFRDVDHASVARCADVSEFCHAAFKQLLPGLAMAAPPVAQLPPFSQAGGAVRVAAWPAAPTPRECRSCDMCAARRSTFRAVGACVVRLRSADLVKRGQA